MIKRSDQTAKYPAEFFAVYLDSFPLMQGSVGFPVNMVRHLV